MCNYCDILGDNQPNLIESDFDAGIFGKLHVQVFIGNHGVLQLYPWTENDGMETSNWTSDKGVKFKYCPICGEKLIVSKDIF